MFQHFAGFVVARSKYILFVLVVIAVVAGLVACRIRCDFTPQSLYDARDGAVRFAEEHKATFGYEDAVVMVAVEATGRNDVLAPDILEWQWTVSNRLQALPHVENVESIAVLQIPRISLADNFALRFTPLIHEFPIDDDAEELIRLRVSRFNRSRKHCWAPTAAPPQSWR